MRHTLLLITGEELGRGDDDLGRRLMTKFLAQVMARPEVPHTIAFYNAGVKLLTGGSPVLDVLQRLEAAGSELVACGTCVDAFGLADTLAVGRVTDMREIVSGMMDADKVVTV